MTVSAMQTLVAQLLGDTGNTRWTAASHILPALNISQHDFMFKLLAYSGGENDNVYDALTELQASKSTSVDTSGYALSGLNSTPGPMVSSGYIASKGTIDSVVRWTKRIPLKDISRLNNRFEGGNDENPAVYILSNTYYLVVTTGTYPVTMTIYYIREPKELVASGASGYQATTCELNPSQHRLICEMAAGECHRMVGDQTNATKYKLIEEKTDKIIQSIAIGSKVQPQDKKIKA